MGQAREDQGADAGHAEQVQGADGDGAALLRALGAVLDRHRVDVQDGLRLRGAHRVRVEGPGHA